MKNNYQLFSFRKHISDLFKLGCKGHNNFNFVDVSLSSDTRLFIDPWLIEKAKDSWSCNANTVLQSYMDCLFDAFKDKSAERLSLLAHAKEQNATKLGYGNGYNGKGKTPKGLFESFSGLSDLIQKIPTIRKASDLKLFVQNFGEDNMSDLITNILHLQLNEFTIGELTNFGIIPNGETTFWTWDMVGKDWVQVKRPSYVYGGNEILLVPKWIVRKNYLVCVHQYLYTVIIDRIRETEHSGLPKKDIWNNIPHTSNDWEYQFVLSYTCNNPYLLANYHELVPKRYNRCNGNISDESLDITVYGKPFETLV